jgi:hypothetical protein
MLHFFNLFISDTFFPYYVTNKIEQTRGKEHDSENINAICHHSKEHSITRSKHSEFL